MELDKRIKKLSDILTCFDVQKAGQFLGHEGYFADVNSSYQSLDNRAYGILTEIKDTAYPFKMNNNDYWRFFIPEIRLKPKEKKLRPYTLMEFCDKFPVGLPIKYRRKGNEGWERYLILNGYRHEHEQRNDRTITYIYIGNNPFTLDELFNEYEWQEHYTEDFKPFGVEIEE